MRTAAAVRAARILVAVGLAVAAGGCSGPAAGHSGSVTILVPFTGRQFTAFSLIVQQWGKNNGITVNPEPTRSLTAELAADLQDNNLPAVAVLPSIGAISTYRPELKKLNKLIPLADYGRPWSALMRPGSGPDVYAAPIKADVKSLIWFDPAVSHFRPQTLQQLVSLSASLQKSGQPWCLALSSAATSGWPGTDWIADILLSQSGAVAYQHWIQGTLPWTSVQVQQAWQLWGEFLGYGRAIQGGLAAALRRVTGPGPGADYPSPGHCLLAHGALVDEGFTQRLDGKPQPKFGTGYSFFAFPPATPTPASAIQVSADFIGMFYNTPAARALVRYLTRASTQKLMVRNPQIDGFSVDNKVPVSDYHDPARRQIAQLLTSGQHELCFGASDAMPPDLSAAFDQSALEYLADPGRLAEILTELSVVQREQQDASSQNAFKACAASPAQRKQS